MSKGNSIEGAILNYIQEREDTQRRLDEARKKENELCAQLVEEYGHEDLAELIRDSAKW